ncbi:MAG: beta-ketoacyl synthase chain length factor [Myxococcales bacterium]|nr:beta-ketoacyl synthase chain length factor [Myxococcales bacterium]
MSLALGTPLHVLGVGYFSTAHGTSTAGGPRTGPHKPAFALLVGRARRFTSLVMQMHVEVCQQATAGLPREVACGSVFCSNHGEVQTAADIIGDIREHQAVSSARFALSVHNSPSGVYSIAAGRREPTTTITSGASSFAAGMVEAVLTAQERAGVVLVSYADEPVPVVFGGDADSDGRAVALLLGDATALTSSGLASLGMLSLAERAATYVITQADALAAGAALAALVKARQPGQVALGSLRDGFDIVAHVSTQVAS